MFIKIPPINRAARNIPRGEDIFRTIDVLAPSWVSLRPVDVHLGKPGPTVFTIGFKNSEEGRESIRRAIGVHEPIVVTGKVLAWLVGCKLHIEAAQGEKPLPFGCPLENSLYHRIICREICGRARPTLRLNSPPVR